MRTLTPTEKTHLCGALSSRIGDIEREGSGNESLKATTEELVAMLGWLRSLINADKLRVSD